MLLYNSVFIVIVAIGDAAVSFNVRLNEQMFNSLVKIIHYDGNMLPVITRKEI